MTASNWFTSLWKTQTPQQVFQQHLIQLDESVGDELGRGAYGAVFKVKYNGANCVAKRILGILTGLGAHQHVGKDQYKPLLDKFRAECDLLSKLRHPNVVQFIGVCQPTPDPRHLTLVMEEMHMNLDELIKAHKPINEGIKLQILLDVSAGLIHIHSHGVIHRDLNAGNVLLTRDLRAKIADFGMSRLLPKNTPLIRPDMTMMPGAPDFMPPEAMTGAYDIKLDTFSFGHLLLYLILEEYPSPKYYSFQEIRNMKADEQIEIKKRIQWLDKMGKDHKLYELTIQCLMDEPKDRPTIDSINKKITLCMDTNESNYFGLLKSELNQYKTAITEMIKQLPGSFSSEKAEIADLKQQLEQSKEQEERILQDKVTEIASKNKQIERLTTQLDQTRQEFNQLSYRHTTELQLSIQEKEDQINQQQQLIDELTCDKRTELATKDEEIARLTAELDNISKEFTEKFNEHTIIVQQKNDHIELITNIHKTELQEKNDFIEIITNRHTTELKHSIQEKNDQINQQQQLIDELTCDKRTEAALKDDKIARLTAELDDVRKEFTEQLSEHAMVVQQKNDHIELITNRHTTQLQEKNDHIEVITIRHTTELQHSIQEKNDQINQQQQLIDELTHDKGTEAATKDEEIIRLTAELDNSRRKFTEQNAHIELITNKHTTELQEKNDHIELLNIQLDKYAKEKELIVQEKDAIIAEKMKMEAEIVKLTTTHEDNASQRVIALETLNKELEAKVKKLESDVFLLIEQKSQLSKQVMEIEEHYKRALESKKQLEDALCEANEKLMLSTKDDIIASPASVIPPPQLQVDSNDKCMIPMSSEPEQHKSDNNEVNNIVHLRNKPVASYDQPTRPFSYVNEPADDEEDVLSSLQVKLRKRRELEVENAPPEASPISNYSEQTIVVAADHSKETRKKPPVPTPLGRTRSFTLPRPNSNRRLSGNEPEITNELSQLEQKLRKWRDRADSQSETK